MLLKCHLVLRPDMRKDAPMATHWIHTTHYSLFFKMGKMLRCMVNVQI